MKKTLVVISCLGAFTSAWAQPTETPEPPPGWWLIPKTKTQMKVGGYVKLDFIHDFNPIASPDFFDVSKIPTDGSQGQSTHLHAKETRLFWDVRTPSKVGELRAYAEGDFYGTNGAFRLRHAFVEIGGKWLAGQWWSNFMDENIIPNTLDFEKPAAYAFKRDAMLRYKHALSEHAYFAVAVEEPSTNAQTPAQPGKFESPLPDITARYRLTKKWGHLQLSAFTAKLVYRFTDNTKDAVTLYGANLSGQVNFNESRNKIIYQAVYGQGVGRYRGGLSAGLDDQGNLQALPEGGLTLGLEHQWNAAFSSLLVYNTGFVNNSDGQPGNALKRADYAAANLVWHFAENAFAGVEYLWGLRRDFDDEEGTANRLQLSVRYSFNMK